MMPFALQHASSPKSFSIFRWNRRSVGFNLAISVPNFWLLPGKCWVRILAGTILRFRGLPRSYQAHTGIVPIITPRSLPTITLPRYSSLVTQSSDAMNGGGSKNKQLAIHDILDADLFDVSCTVDTHDRELKYLRSCNSMHIRRSTTAALWYGGPFEKLVSLESPEDLHASCADGVPVFIAMVWFFPMTMPDSRRHCRLVKLLWTFRLGNIMSSPKRSGLRTRRFKYVSCLKRTLTRKSLQLRRMCQTCCQCVADTTGICILRVQDGQAYHTLSHVQQPSCIVSFRYKILPSIYG